MIETHFKVFAIMQIEENNKGKLNLTSDSNNLLRNIINSNSFLHYNTDNFNGKNLYKPKWLIL